MDKQARIDAALEANDFLGREWTKAGGRASIVDQVRQFTHSQLQLDARKACAAAAAAGQSDPWNNRGGAE